MIFSLCAAPIAFVFAAESDDIARQDPLSETPARAVSLVGSLVEEALFFFPEIIVKGSRVPSAVGDDLAAEAAHDVILVGRGELESTSRSLPEALARKEAVTYTDDTGLGLNARVDLRGFGGEGKQALVLFDGVRAVEPFDNSVAWHLYPAEFIERAEILPGGGSTVYGEGAFSGVIDLATKNPTKERRIRAEASGGSFDAQKYFAEVSGTLNRIGVYSGVRYLNTDGYRVNSDHENTSTLTKLHYALGDLVRMGYSLYYSGSKTGIPGPLSAAEAAMDRRQQDPDGQLGDRFTDRLLQHQLTFDWTHPDAGLALTNVFSVRYRDQDSLQTFGGIFGGTSDNSLRTETYSDVLQGTWSYEVGPWEIDSVLGAEWSLDDVLNPTRFASGFGTFDSRRAIDRMMVGVFFQNDTQLNERWTLETGIRWDRIDWNIYDHLAPQNQKRKEASQVSSRIGLLWKMTDWASVFGSYSESFKAPDANTLIFETPNLFTPNPDIDPQTAGHYELGLRGTAGSTVGWKATGFYIETKREILFNDITNLNENFDTRRTGIETAVDVELTPQLAARANYTYTRPTFDNGAFDGKRIPLTPESRWNARVDWSPVRSWLFTLQASGADGQWALNDFNNLFSADDYWTLGIRVAYRLGDWEFFVQGDNLLNEEYSSFVTSNAIDTVNYNPAPGSQATFGVKWSG